MYFQSVNDLFVMNGHGVYVWSAYAIGFAVLATLTVIPLTRHTRLRQEILRYSEENP